MATQCELFDTLDRLDGDPAVHCIVVRGTDKVFAAGIDLEKRSPEFKGR